MNVFVTVGTQLPFERLIRAVERWAIDEQLVETVFTQCGPTTTPPKLLRWAKFIDVACCLEETAKADLVVGHAGMGTILTALELGKPIIVLPREAARQEHRNNHQIDMAHRLTHLHNLQIAWSDAELIGLLRRARQRHRARPKLRAAPDMPPAPPALLLTLRQQLLATLDPQTAEQPEVATPTTPTTPQPVRPGKAAFVAKHNDLVRHLKGQSQPASPTADRKAA